MHHYLPINLPSNGRIYQSQIRVRTLCGNDEVLLAQMNPENIEGKFYELLRNVVQEFDPAELTFGDRLWLILWLSINSYSETVSANVICINCFEPSIQQINLRQIKAICLPETFSQPYPINTSQGTIKLRLLTVDDLVKLERYEKEHSDGMIRRYAMSIVMDGTDDDKMNFYKSLPARDTALIRAFQEKFYHGPDFSCKVLCPKCGKEQEIELPFQFELLFPTGQALRENFGERI